MKQDHTRHQLYEALEDIKKFQDALTNTWSKYYDHLLVKLLGTDTIPFVLMTKDSKLLRLTNSKEKVDTVYFRIESIEYQKKQLELTLLRAFDHEEKETTSMRDVVRLEKTAAVATVDLRYISAVQLVTAHYLTQDYYVEKW